MNYIRIIYVPNEKAYASSYTGLVNSFSKLYTRLPRGVYKSTHLQTFVSYYIPINLIEPNIVELLCRDTQLTQIIMLLFFRFTDRV